jgi:hypothetical protein
MEPIEQQPAKKRKTWISVTQVARRYELQTNTVRNWFRVGIALPSGERLRLRVVCLGGRFFTRRKWVREFVAAMTEAKLAAPEPAPKVETPTQQAKRFKREKEAASKRLHDD